ncbi:MAG: alanine--tRNA ligase [Oscillospiraceae bacterium]|jgi:alanyl-tRNA synthetase|nr:alanine--tRNA ligase [Oscillospiraceae bacterium]
MQPLGLNEIREKFLSFFQSKGSLRLPSFPLVPQGDTSLLLINSGMAPLKPYFSGELPPPRGNRRVTTCQKCIRTPDIERVGKTSRHGTFFEMLGNFSFGDYFKSEACAWAWEFCTEVMRLPTEKLYVTVYNGEGGGIPDDEAYNVWVNEVGIEPDHVSRLGKADNFWEIGAGPCGPCSEIYFDRGEKYGCGDDHCAPGCDCDRYVEFWNLVFTQFNNDGSNNYTPLSHKNIDTGMGLERIACIMQDAESLFDVDTIMNITRHVSRVTGAEYGQSESVDVSLRVITDHIRSTVMMICDGVLPSNEGRGYVLRRLLRRAARHGKLLGVSKPFLYEVSETVIAASSGAYPELAERRAQIARVIKAEEERFSATIDAGLKILMELISVAEQADVKTLSGADCFKLYDTFGFPIDLTREILEERGMTADTDGFNVYMTEQRERARAATAALGDHGWEQLDIGLPKEEKTVFTGYDSFEETDAIVRAIGDGWCVLDKTPFYAEKGGQIADTGTIAGYRVVNVRETKDGKYLHLGEFEVGSVAPGDMVAAVIDIPRRLDIMRAHSSAHLLQAALRKVLGNHVEQAGSWVGANQVRFDFTHFQAVSAEELRQIEDAVNEWILADMRITVQEMPIDDAKKSGAIALFGEKYGDVVRVVKMGGISVEFCGGTHLRNTAKIGQIRLTSEFSVAAGVRRIEAVTGSGAIDSYRADSVKVGEEAERLRQEIKERGKEIDKLTRSWIGALVKDVPVVPGAITAIKLDNLNNDQLKIASEHLLGKTDAAFAVVLASIAGNKINFVAAANSEAVASGIKAGDLIKKVTAATGGKGGGRPELAMGAGADIGKLDAALAEVC